MSWKRLDEIERDYYAAKADEGWWTGLMATVGGPVLLVLLLGCIGAIAYGVLSLFL